jgi:hypothetical protein
MRIGRFIIFEDVEKDTVETEESRESIDTAGMSEKELVDFAFKILLDNRVISSGEQYTEPFDTQEDWDKWCTWAGRQGKIARSLRSLAKSAMSFKFTGDNEEALDVVRTMARKTHLNTKLIKAFKDWLKYGRCFIEPNWEITKVGNKVKGKDLIGVKVPNPTTIKVFRDSESDLRELKASWGELEKMRATYISEVKEGRGDGIIGFVQHWYKRHEKKAIFFEPDELIFIPREPDEKFPDGVSILTENYTNLMNKWGIERSQAIMAKRHTDPKHMFRLAKEWWNKLSVVKAKIEASGLKAGTDFYYPDGITVDIIEPKGSGIAIIKAQEHLENQVNAGIGFADSFTESDSSNRAVGEVQLQFFERDMRPDRATFAQILEDRLIIPYVVAKGFKEEDAPNFNFDDLTPKDEIEFMKALSPYLPYMTDSQLRKVFEDIGYPLAEDEEPNRPLQMTAELASQKGVPKDVLRTSKSVREEIKEEIKRLQAELKDVLGLG